MAHHYATTLHEPQRGSPITDAKFFVPNHAKMRVTFASGTTDPAITNSETIGVMRIHQYQNKQVRFLGIMGAASALVHLAMGLIIDGGVDLFLPAAILDGNGTWVVDNDVASAPSIAATPLCLPYAYNLGTQDPTDVCFEPPPMTAPVANIPWRAAIFWMTE